MVFRLKNPSGRFFVQLPFLFASRIEKSLKTKNRIFQHCEHQSLLGFQESLALGSSAVFVGCEFVRLEQHGRITVIISIVAVIHVL